MTNEKRTSPAKVRAARLENADRAADPARSQHRRDPAESFVMQLAQGFFEGSLEQDAHAECVADLHAGQEPESALHKPGWFARG